MANLLGQDIGLNYKGLINIGSTINQNISASLQSLTDGDGNLLPLQISTTQMSVGGATGTGRLIVRGDGTNPIFRAENSDGTYRYLMTTTQQIFNTNGGAFSIRPNEGTITNPGVDINTATFGGNTSIVMAGGRYTITHSSGNNANAGFIFRVNQGINNLTAARFGFETNSSTISIVAGNSYGLRYVDTFAAAAGSAVYEPLSINYTINNSGAQTGRTTGIFLNATETNLNGMTHNLMDLQVGGTSRFRINNAGVLSINQQGLTYNANLINATDSFGVFNTSNASGRFVSVSDTSGFGAYSVLTGLRARGTASSPTSPLLDDAIFGIISNAYDGTAAGGGTAGVFFLANANVTSGNAPQRIVFATSETNNLNRLERLKIMPNGQIRVTSNLAVGLDVATTARLHVRGDGTNPIARFETSAGVERVRIASDGALSSTSYSTDVQRLGFNGGTFGVNRGYIRAESNGVFTLSNASENDFGRLNYGLATSSFPALKRSTTILQARLADDSDFTFIQGKLRTETNFTSEPAIVANGYIVLYDLDGTAYKVLATAL